MKAKDDGLFKGNTQTRRTFISIGTQAATATALLAIPGSGIAEYIVTPERTVQDVIDMVLKAVPSKLPADTVDTIKTGNAGDKVTGIVTSMFATIPVIQEAIRLKASFIIAHEPVFYNHQDDIGWVAGNEVQQLKQQLLTEHHITVWRCHDAIHMMEPDGVTYGVLQQAGWEHYYKAGNLAITIPTTPLIEIIQHLKKSLQVDHLRMIGDPHHPCSKIIIMPGAWGGKEHVAAILKEKPDLLIAGEANEWETPEFVRDARAQGRNISLLVLGHAVSEEPGMAWMARWLQPQLPGLRVTHIASKSPFTLV